MNSRTRTLALLALLLPGLILSGALHLCVCLGSLLGAEGTCATAATDCCASFDGDASAQRSQSCSECCIVLDVDEGPPIAPAPESGAALAALDALPPAPAIAAPAALLERDCARPLRAAPPGLDGPGRAPIPLRI